VTTHGGPRLRYAITLTDVLDLSRIEAGKMTVERIACSPFVLVAEVASPMQLRAATKGLAFAVEYRGAIPERIQSDPTRLRQVLLNLLGNAIKFTEAGGVRLTVEMVEGEGAARGLRFAVVDSGVGMTPQVQVRLFQPFTQADNSATRRFGSTGLGLMISKRLVEILGGTIEVWSSPGQGSTFAVTIDPGPLDGVCMLAGPLAGTPAAADHVRDAGAADLACRVLLAEDGPDNQRLISFYLRRAGADVVVAENGQTATELALAAEAERRPFAVVLMDMQMPVLDGYEATAGLRRAGYRRPIVALTAHAKAIGSVAWRRGATIFSPSR